MDNILSFFIKGLADIVSNGDDNANESEKDFEETIQHSKKLASTLILAVLNQFTLLNVQLHVPPLVCLILTPSTVFLIIVPQVVCLLHFPSFPLLGHLALLQYICNTLNDNNLSNSIFSGSKPTTYLWNIIITTMDLKHWEIFPWLPAR